MPILYIFILTHILFLFFCQIHINNVSCANIEKIVKPIKKSLKNSTNCDILI